ncbi:MAG: hypothetical protein LIP09_10265 [Bacteroidales bacterium]|nr:hypothetical protein [Bacteroidales bacterium]
MRSIWRYIKRFGKWFANKEWWVQWSIAFIATACGILVTVGTDSWLQYRDKQEKAKRALEVILVSLHDEWDEMDGDVERVQFQDSIMQAVNIQFQGDSLNEASCQLFYKMMSAMAVHHPWQATYGVYYNSFDFWLAIDNPAVMQALGQAYTNEGMFLQIMSTLQTRKRELFTAFSSYKWKEEYPSFRVLVRQWMRNPELKLFLDEFSRCSKMMAVICQEQAHLLAFLRDSLGISEERILELSTDYEMGMQEYYEAKPQN